MLASSSDVAGKDVGAMKVCAMLIEVLKKTDGNEVDFSFCVRSGTYLYACAECDVLCVEHTFFAKYILYHGICRRWRGLLQQICTRLQLACK